MPMIGSDVASGFPVRMLLGRHLPAVLVLVERLDPTVDAEVDRLVEALDSGGAMRPGVLPDLDAAGVNDLAHVWLSLVWFSPVRRSVASGHGSP